MVAQVNVPPLLIQILFVFFPENPKISKNFKLNHIETKTSDNKRWKTNEIKQANLKEDDKKKESKKKSYHNDESEILFGWRSWSFQP